jgi:predicted nucleic acid-binding protein
MTVLDASAVLELLLGTRRGRVVAARIADPGRSIHAPHLLDVEVAQALRRYARLGELDSGTAAAALDDLRALDLERHAHEPLLERVWALRKSLTVHDAVYLALAEALGAVLLTCDARLGRAPGAQGRVEIVAD